MNQFKPVLPNMVLSIDSHGVTVELPLLRALCALHGEITDYGLVAWDLARFSFSASMAALMWY
jgi:hypothetical protein